MPKPLSLARALVLVAIGLATVHLATGDDAAERNSTNTHAPAMPSSLAKSQRSVLEPIFRLGIEDVLSP